MKLHEILIDTANIAFNLQNPDGSMPAGHNGPYYDPETPVRNTAHYLFLFASLYQKTGDVKYKNAGEKAISFLLSQDTRPYNQTFHCRNKPGKDKCNGLIGQAWVIEALIKAGQAFQRDDCTTLSEKIFLLHPWNKNTALWHRVEIDGTILPYDGTFNHQLWFAAVGSMLKNPEITKQVKRFLYKVVKKIQLYPDGIIYHNSTLGSLLNYLGHDITIITNQLFTRIHQKEKNQKMYDKSVGYHAFNLYGLAILKQAYPSEKIWTSNLIEKISRPCYNELFLGELHQSLFGYQYNISGIEIAFFLENFYPKQIEYANKWINYQLNVSFLDQAHPLSKNVSDGNTASARIYEAARIKGDYEVNFD